MEIKRDLYLNKLIRKQKNGLIKIITGIRRCGKSYLLFHLFHKYLLNSGVPPDHIIEIALDDRRNMSLRDPDALLQFLLNTIQDQQDYYIILDEVQYLNEFEDILNTLLHISNTDVYVTGSNSKFLVSDIITEFRGRGDALHVYPLKFSEYLSVCKDSPERAWDDYLHYGGLPMVPTIEDPSDKADYLNSLFQTVYVSDIVERNNVQNKAELDELLDVLASAIGSYTSHLKLARTFKSIKGKSLTDKTIKNYIDYLIDAFLISKAVRYDIKGKHYIGALSKYYFEDVGLRNARLGFRQTEQTHLMENIIYNELRIRGYHVDVGMVEQYETLPGGQRQKKQLEVDFIATRGSEKYYIQSAFALPNADKASQEQRSLMSIRDSFKKIIVVKDDIRIRRNEDGINTIGLLSFLLDENSLNL